MANGTLLPSDKEKEREIRLEKIRNSVVNKLHQANVPKPNCGPAGHITVAPIRAVSQI